MKALSSSSLLLLVWVGKVFLLTLFQPTCAFTNYNNNNIKAFSIWQQQTSICTKQNDKTQLWMAPSREDEIRRKIIKLKKEGRLKGKASSSSSSSSSDEESNEKDFIDKMNQQRLAMKNTPLADAYAEKIAQRLGKKGTVMNSKRLGSVMNSSSNSGVVMEKPETNNDNNNSDDEDDNDYEFDEDEIDLLKEVESRLLEERRLENQEKLKQEGSLLGPDLEDKAKEMEKIQTTNNEKEEKKKSSTTDTTLKKTTSGVGGAWSREDASMTKTDSYRPKTGSWGYFPRPKNISTAYGGGKKVGADARTTAEDESRKQQSVEDTRERLRRYREKVGIDVQSEKDHAKEIEEALLLGQRAMQRGVYNTAVSVLEKVTKYCSTNSKVGGQIYLELAMAYEASGETEKAITVYSTLTTSRIEEIKFNAKRLLYGIEAMNFMRNDLKAKSFSRKKVQQTFIDTTGMQNMAQNFDKVYNTAYLDLDSRGSFYKKLTENVVRSVREARQILLRATGTGDVERLKIVQALRSLSRNFDDAISDEKKRNKPKEESVAVINGVPIAKKVSSKNREPMVADMESFILGTPSQMKELLDGEWKLQLMADKKGDGVNFYNSTLSWQLLDTKSMTFEGTGPAGFLTLSQNGCLDFEEENRILSHTSVKSGGSGAWLSGFISKSSPTGALAAATIPQQVISVDSTMLITRNGIDKSSVTENVQDYFSIWRKVEVGTFSNP